MSISENLSNYYIPDNMRVYAIGDLHGYLEPLQEMHLKIDAHLRENPVEKAVVVYLGDYVDRGPFSKQVIDRLCLLQQEQTEIARVFIKGNHEWAMQGFMEQPLVFGPEYLKWGGLETIQSYGVDVPEHISQDAIVDGVVLPAEYERLAEAFKEKVPQEHLMFLESLELCKMVGDFLFVHAGIKPEVPLEAQNAQDLMRIRGVFSNYKKDHGFKVVHGHQISEDVELMSNRIGVDTGFYEQGVLSCVALEQNHVEILQVRQKVICAWTQPKSPYDPEYDSNE